MSRLYEATSFQDLERGTLEQIALAENASDQCYIWFGAFRSSLESDAPAEWTEAQRTNAISWFEASLDAYARAAEYVSEMKRRRRTGL